MKLAARSGSIGLSRNVYAPMSEAQRNASTVSSIESWTCWPSPVRSRASSAAVTAWAAVIELSLSGSTVRIRRGRSVSDPAWMVVSPDRAWTTGS